VLTKKNLLNLTMLTITDTAIYSGVKHTMPNRTALPYQTTDPIPGRTLSLFEKSVDALKPPLVGLDFVEDAIRRNGDDSSGDGRTFISDLHSLKDHAERAYKKATEIIRYGLTDSARNNYELMKNLSWTSEMLGYWKTNELQLLNHSLPHLTESLLDFFYRYFGAKVDLSNPVDSIYNSSADDVEEYFAVGLSVWDRLKNAFAEIKKLQSATKTFYQFIDYYTSQYDYAKKWQQESHSKPPSKIFPTGLQDLEIMWHVTTAYSKVLAEGLKAKKDLSAPAGLGGGSRDLVSFTASYPHAEGIKDAMIDMAYLMRGPRTVEAVDKYRKELGVSDSGFDWVLSTFKSNWGNDIEDRFGYLVEYTLLKAQEEGLRYNPVFFGSDIRERFAALDPNEIDIIEAVVDTRGEDTTYHRAEEEWRIPPKNILSVGPVGSQSETLQKAVQKAGSFLPAQYAGKRIIRFRGACYVRVDSVKSSIHHLPRKAMLGPIQEVHFLSEDDMLKLPPSAFYGVISITDPGRRAPLPSGWGSVLRLQFDDVEEAYPLRPYGGSSTWPFDEVDAQKIISWLAENKNKLHGVYVHCWGGVSRSAAVAKYIAERLGLPFDQTYDAYNILVYDTLKSIG
jgi:hypothetical protein